MTIFINIQKKQIFAKWLRDSDWVDEVKKWEAKGWLPILTNTSLTWQQVWEGWKKLNRSERLKLEQEVLG